MDLDKYRFWETVKINGKEVEMLIDTGAHTSIIRPETAERIGFHPTHEVVVAHGAAHITGKAGHIEIELSGCKAEVQVTVALVKNEVLGADFLGETRAIINMGNKRVVCGR